MIHIVDIPIYKCSVVFLIESSRQDWSKFFDTHKAEITDTDNTRVLQEFDEEFPGWVIHTEGNDYICYISNKDIVGLVAHELFHAGHSVLYDRGCIMDAASEPWAYLIEFLTNEFYNLVEKKKK